MMHIINGIRDYVIRGAAFSLPQILFQSKPEIYAEEWGFFILMFGNSCLVEWDSLQIG